VRRTVRSTRAGRLPRVIRRDQPLGLDELTNECQMACCAHLFESLRISAVTAVDGITAASSVSAIGVMDDLTTPVALGRAVTGDGRVIVEGFAFVPSWTKHDLVVTRRHSWREGQPAFACTTMD
jgi:hypothetical protein